MDDAITVTKGNLTDEELGALVAMVRRMRAFIAVWLFVASAVQHNDPHDDWTNPILTPTVAS